MVILRRAYGIGRIEDGPRRSRFFPLSTRWRLLLILIIIAMLICPSSGEALPPNLEARNDSIAWMEDASRNFNLKSTYDLIIILNPFLLLQNRNLLLLIVLKHYSQLLLLLLRCRVDEVNILFAGKSENWMRLFRVSLSDCFLRKDIELAGLRLKQAEVY
ncbi:hypothetical protein RIF29_11250 [Crotalaria pallida]|uniref:Uncharacterized protein n=1 Tax=Crotalaria pallida TaxID=3830 RepID=A0AAN9ILX9_CROPI